MIRTSASAACTSTSVPPIAISTPPSRRATTKLFIPKIAAGGRTAVQVADQLEARLLTRYGVSTVTYADGTRVQVRSYARMAARTKSGVAYNSGTLNQLHQNGVAYVEVFDGPDCGWAFHQDGDKANGSFRRLAAAAEHPLSHPNCRRAFGGRPDVTTDEQAASAAPSTNPEQIAAQRAADEARLATSTRPSEVRRARLQAQRQARLLGTQDPESVGTIIEQVLRERGLTQ